MRAQLKRKLKMMKAELLNIDTGKAKPVTLSDEISSMTVFM